MLDFFTASQGAVASRANSQALPDGRGSVWSMVYAQILAIGQPLGESIHYVAHPSAVL
jgi:hypothetical protein